MKKEITLNDLLIITKEGFEKINQDLKKTNDKIDLVKTDLSGKIKFFKTELTKKIDNVERGLTEKIDNVEKGLTEKIDNVEVGLNKKIDLFKTELNKNVDDLAIMSKNEFDKKADKDEIRIIVNDALRDYTTKDDLQTTKNEILPNGDYLVQLVKTNNTEIASSISCRLRHEDKIEKNTIKIKDHGTRIKKLELAITKL